MTPTSNNTFPPNEYFYYLASPYSKYPLGIEQAFRDVCLLTGRLINRGNRVYSPIAHTHPIAMESNMDPLDHTIWLPSDRPMMMACEALLVAKMDSWGDSYGISVEIDEFAEMGKPIYFLDPETLRIGYVKV